MPDPVSRSRRLDRAIADLLAQAPEVEAAAVVSFDGLPMASALPATMNEDRVAAMSAALLSLGERAAEGLGRGALSQVYIEGEQGTVFLISADDEAVLVAVASPGAKAGMMLYEVRRAAVAVAAALRKDDAETASTAEAYAPSQAFAPTQVAGPAQQLAAAAQPVAPPLASPALDAAAQAVAQAVAGTVASAAGSPETLEPEPSYPPTATETAWPSYLTDTNVTTPAAEPPAWS